MEDIFLMAEREFTSALRRVKAKVNAQQLGEAYEEVMGDLRALARAAIERSLGDVVEPDATAGEIEEEAYTLALDALRDRGIYTGPGSTAVDIAREVAREVAG